MDVTLVGGNFGMVKSSKVITLIQEALKEYGIDNLNSINGGKISELPRELNSDLSIWMPNIDNEEEKHYPVKKKGSVLICSKVMRDGYKDVDAVSRIFKMHGNAVIAIYTDTKPFTFKLIDALANIWYYGSDINSLVKTIISLYEWTKQAKRINTKQNNNLIPEPHNHLKDLIDLNNKLASFVRTSCGERFFGNISTRCQKLFPSVSDEFGIYVSPRNSNKEQLTPDDMVYMNNSMEYIGNNKPSVDSPCQIQIYKNCPNIHYMIHGHAFIKNAPTTKEYYLCGDVREADEVSFIIQGNGYINLKNHGFLIYAEDIDNLSKIIEELITDNNFYYERG